jgi:hypothetical protein
MLREEEDEQGVVLRVTSILKPTWCGEREGPEITNVHGVVWAMERVVAEECSSYQTGHRGSRWCCLWSGRMLGGQCVEDGVLLELWCCLVREKQVSGGARWVVTKR